MIDVYWSFDWGKKFRYWPIASFGPSLLLLSSLFLLLTRLALFVSFLYGLLSHVLPRRDLGSVYPVH